MEIYPISTAFPVQAAFFDADDNPYTPAAGHEPKVTVTLYKLDGTFEVLVNNVTASAMVGNSTIWQYMITALINDTLGTIVAVFTTTDPALAAYRELRERIHVVQIVSASSDPLATPVPGAYAAGTAGYLLGLLDDIKTRTDLIAPGRVRIEDMHNRRTGRLTLYRGDTPLFVLQDLDPVWAGATNIKLSIRLAGTEGAALKSLTGSVVSSSSLSFQITTDFTADLLEGDDLYVWDVQGTLSSGEIRSPIWKSPLTVIDDVTKS